jgi:peptide/nickel transport system permease protein
VTRYLVRRLGWSLVVLWFVVTTTFAMTYGIPADPARTLVGPHADAATIASLRREMKLDRPVWVQYAAYLGRLAHGDLGRSYRTRRPVLAVVAEKIWPTAQLALTALALALLAGVPLGVAAAVRRGRAADTIASAVALVGQSAPTFFLGPLLMYLGAFRFGWFPVSGYGEPGWDRLWHLFLPALTLAPAGIASYARLVRAELTETLGEDYVRTSRAKGLPPAAVVGKHALRNALPPVATLAGLDLGVLLGGAVVTESIFGWPGLGREAVLAIANVDLPIILGVVMVSAVAILVASLLADLAHALLDPRIRMR